MSAKEGADKLVTMLDDAIKKLHLSLNRRMVLKVYRSYALQDREERDGRLRAIMALTVELEKIKAVSSFSTRLANGVLSDIIEGDWEEAARLGDHFTFSGESPELIARYAPLWVTFRGILAAECLAAKARANNGGAASN